MQKKTGEFCDARSINDMPFPICARHAIQVWRAMQAVIDETKAASPDALLAAINGKPIGVLPDPEDAVSQRRQERRAEVRAQAQQDLVYYLRSDGLIKIGTTADLESRLKNYPPQVEVLALEPGGRALEAQRHKQFRKHLTARREWFVADPEILTHVDRVVTEHGPAATIMKARRVRNRAMAAVLREA